MKKLLNKKGFTLAELLIVVAIIAILVAVSIPIFTSRLNEAKRSTDLANERAAKAAAVVEFMSDDNSAEISKLYDAKDGVLVPLNTKITSYGKSTTVPEGATAANIPVDKVLQVAVDTEGKVTLAWVAAPQ